MMSMPQNVNPPTITPLPDVDDMTDRQLAEETLRWLRDFGAMMQAMQAMGPAAIIRSMMSGKNGR